MSLANHESLPEYDNQDNARDPESIERTGAEIINLARYRNGQTDRSPSDQAEGTSPLSINPDNAPFTNLTSEERNYLLGRLNRSW